METTGKSHFNILRHIHISRVALTFRFNILKACAIDWDYSDKEG